MNQKLRSANQNTAKTLNKAHQEKRKQKVVCQNNTIEVSMLRKALVDAIDENEILKGRVFQLEAVLAAFQMQMQQCQKKYTRDLKQLCRNFKQLKKTKLSSDTLPKSNSCIF